jgi:hypothetical protein
MDITKQNKINLISIYMSWQNKLLKEIYYNPKTGFKSQNRLYKEALKQDQRIRHNDVDSFLKQQEENQINKLDNNKKYLFKINAPPSYYQMDLTFYPKYKSVNNGYTIMLCLIEIASRKAYIIPLKTKNEKEIYEAINKLINKIKGIKAITTDNGSEFTNKKVDKLLKDNHIVHYLGQAEDKRTLSIVERFNRTIKNYLRKYFTAYNTYKWINVIDDIVENYNNSYHSGIKTSPNQITNEQIERIYTDNIQYNSYLKDRLNIKIGDLVRTLNSKHIFEKEGEKYSTVVYEVVGIIGNKYEIKNIKTNNILQKKYGIYELSKISETIEKFDNKKNNKNKQQILKDYKTNLKLQKEGLDKKNIISSIRRPKRITRSKIKTMTSIKRI